MENNILFPARFAMESGAKAILCCPPFVAVDESFPAASCQSCCRTVVQGDNLSSTADTATLDLAQR
jgi:hypothetical protein